MTNYKEGLTQSEQVRIEILKLIKDGMTDKGDIYTKVCETLKVERPTVRRCARELLFQLKQYVQVLGSEMPVFETPKPMLKIPDLEVIQT